MPVLTITPNKDAILDLRKKKMMTQEQFAEAADLSVRRIRDLERGKPALPCTIRSLAERFKVDPETLVDGTLPVVDLAYTGAYSHYGLLFLLNYETLSEYHSLIQRLNALLKEAGIPNATLLPVGSVQPGSVRVDLGIHNYDVSIAASLIDGFCKSLFQKFRLAQISVPPRSRAHFFQCIRQLTNTSYDPALAPGENILVLSRSLRRYIEQHEKQFTRHKDRDSVLTDKLYKPYQTKTTK